MTLLLITAIICLAATQVVAQSPYKLATGADATIKVTGSSNVHDWVMASSIMESKGEFTINDDKLTALHAFSFQVAVKTLKSEHKTMDNRMYKTVNESKYPTISYKLTSANITPLSKTKFLIASKGELTIAGTTQTINIEVTAIVNPDNTITCTGSKQIQLTDYGIKPPSFMLGTMKVYNNMNIQFNLIYKK